MIDSIQNYDLPNFSKSSVNFSSDQIKAILLMNENLSITCDKTILENLNKNNGNFISNYNHFSESCEKLNYCLLELNKIYKKYDQSYKFSLDSYVSSKSSINLDKSKIYQFKPYSTSLNCDFSALNEELVFNKMQNCNIQQIVALSRGGENFFWKIIKLLSIGPLTLGNVLINPNSGKNMINRPEKNNDNNRIPPYSINDDGRLRFDPLFLRPEPHIRPDQPNQPTCGQTIPRIEEIFFEAKQTSTDVIDLGYKELQFRIKDIKNADKFYCTKEKFGRLSRSPYTGKPTVLSMRETLTGLNAEAAGYVINIDRIPEEYHDEICNLDFIIDGPGNFTHADVKNPISSKMLQTQNPSKKRDLNKQGIDIGKKTREAKK